MNRNVSSRTKAEAAMISRRRKRRISDRRKCQDLFLQQSSTSSLLKLAFVFLVTPNMAATTLPATRQDENLTDEQVEQMLARATQQLKERKNSNELAKKSEVQTYNFPKLQTGQLEQPYASSHGDVASLDSKRIVEQKQRTGQHGIRKVEDPVASKKAAQEVRSTDAIFLRTFLWL